MIVQIELTASKTPPPACVDQARAVAADERSRARVEGLHLGERKPEVGHRLNHGSNELRVDAPVIIVGGGPVGLALALGLARYERAFDRPRAQSSSRSRSRAPPSSGRARRRSCAIGAPTASLREAGRFVRVLRAVNARTQATFSRSIFRLDRRHLRRSRRADSAAEARPSAFYASSSSSNRLLRAPHGNNRYRPIARCATASRCVLKTRTAREACRGICRRMRRRTRRRANGDRPQACKA